MVKYVKEKTQKFLELIKFKNYYAVTINKNNSLEIHIFVFLFWEFTFVHKSFQLFLSLGEDSSAPRNWYFRTCNRNSVFWFYAKSIFSRSRFFSSTSKIRWYLGKTQIKRKSICRPSWKYIKTTPRCKRPIFLWLPSRTTFRTTKIVSTSTTV